MKGGKRKFCCWILIVIFALSACADAVSDSSKQAPEEERPAVALESAEDAKTKTLRLGSSLYAVRVSRDFTTLRVSNEDWEDDMVARYHNENTLLDFTVYQFSKEGYPDALEEFVRQEAEEYEASEIALNETINGIVVGNYRSIDDYGNVFRENITYAFENNDEYIEINFWFVGYQAESEAQEIISSLTIVDSAPLPLGAYQIHIPEDFTLVRQEGGNPTVYASGSDSLRLYIRHFPAKEASLTDFVRSQGGSDIDTDAEINGIPVASYRSMEALDAAFHSTLTYVLDDGDGFTALSFRLDGITAEAEAEKILDTLSKRP